MKYSIIIDAEREEEIVIYAHSRGELVDKIEKLVLEANEGLWGYDKNDIVKLDSSDIYCFIVEDGRVYAMTEKEKFLLKTRLYSLEESYPHDFVKINQSCLVNVEKIERFSSSIGGSLMVSLKNGYSDYISRRQLKNVKERIGF